MATHSRRRSSLDRASVEAILASGESSQPLASPSPHVGASPNRAQFSMEPPPRPPIKHTRALSSTPRTKPNRLSLSFPIATGNTSDSSRQTPTSSNASSFPPTPADAPVPSPDDPSGFLVAVAGQERRVLELKEELEKAETELKKLKSKWAAHERNKKRAEMRHVEPLRPVQTVTPDGGRSSEEIDGSTPRQSQSIELDRRKALLLNMPKEPRRKVFSGGHHRTLSLLSPDRSHYARPFPPVEESGLEGDGLPRSTTMPDTSQGITKINSNRARHSYQGGITHGAKQVAGEIGAGLWTFLEDLRQATVGDEATATHNRPLHEVIQHLPKKKGSKNSLRSKGKGQRGQSPRGTPSPRTWDHLTGSNLGLGLSDATGNFWPENTPLKRSTSMKAKGTLNLAPPPIDDLDDDWSNWDSPTPKSPRWSGSTELSDPKTPSYVKGEDRPVKIVDQSGDESTPSKQQRDEIQWPALDRLTPGNLKRTVSTIMKEWEKSLTPPPERADEGASNSSASVEATAAKEDDCPNSQLPLI